MKIAVIITAGALACGSAFADKSPSTQHPSAAATQSEARGDDYTTKTKRAFQRLGNKLRGVVQKDHTQQARGTGKDAKDHGARTTAMGAGRDTRDINDTLESAERSRRERMDAAYSNWQSSQKQ